MIEKPEISDNFTMEDLYKIREYLSLKHYEDPEAARLETKRAADKMLAEIEELRQIIENTRLTM